MTRKTFSLVAAGLLALAAGQGIAHAQVVDPFANPVLDNSAAQERVPDLDPGPVSEGTYGPFRNAEVAKAFAAKVDAKLHEQRSNLHTSVDGPWNDGYFVDVNNFQAPPEPQPRMLDGANAEAQQQAFDLTHGAKYIQIVRSGTNWALRNTNATFTYVAVVEVTPPDANGENAVTVNLTVPPGKTVPYSGGGTTATIVSVEPSLQGDSFRDAQQQ